MRKKKNAPALPPALMIQGTGSGVGKSLIAAGLLRALADMGVKAAPFKAQNMALNSFITRDGGEIGRAQALQAAAARVEPTADMNPILLKATGESGSQVIIDGRVFKNMTAREYYAFRDEAWQAVKAAYRRLASQYGAIVIEGAGSPAEINLMDKDIVNMRMARHAGAGVILVGDIERGGVFASLYGTMSLLKRDKKLIKGFIINKFRGDAEILAPGLRMLEEKTGVPPLGVLPYMRIALSAEDSLCLEPDKSHPFSCGANTAGGGSLKTIVGGSLKIVVIRNSFISNFTDLEPLLFEPGVELIYSARGSDLQGADLIIIPGSKNTIHDLLHLRRAGMEEALRRAVKKGVPLIGLCGGYQMLGKTINDPHGVEGPPGETRGMGLLDIETVLEREKITSQVEFFPKSKSSFFAASPDEKLHGYEIHMGSSSGDIGLFGIHRLATGQRLSDGSQKGNVWGTYIHGIFDNDSLRGALLNQLREKHRLPLHPPVNYQKRMDEGIDTLARALREHLDMRSIGRLINAGG